MRLSLQLDRSLRPPRHHFERKHNHSHKIFRLLHASIVEASKSVTDLKTSSDRETLALLTQANIFSNDIQRVVYQLQKIVIRSFKNGAPDAELADAVKQFSLFAYAVQQRFSDDPEILKSQIKENLDKIMPEARRLIDSVKRNQITDYIHDIVYALDNILFAVQKLELRNNHENDSNHDLVTLIIKSRERYVAKLDSFHHVNHSVLRDLKHAAFTVIGKILTIIKTLDEVADSYDETVKKILLDSAFELNNKVALLDEHIRTNYHVHSIKCLLNVCIATLTLELENLLEVLKTKFEDEHEANNLHNLVIQIIIQGLATGDQLCRDVELASNQIDH